MRQKFIFKKIWNYKFNVKLIFCETCVHIENAKSFNVYFLRFLQEKKYIVMYIFDFVFAMYIAQENYERDGEH